MTNYWTPTVGPDNGYGMFWHSPVAVYANMGAAPSAATFGPGPAWIGGVPYWSDGSTWQVVYRTEFYSNMTAFNAAGGAASYGTGPVWIGSSLYWSNGSSVSEVTGGGSSGASNVLINDSNITSSTPLYVALDNEAAPITVSVYLPSGGATSAAVQFSNVPNAQSSAAAHEWEDWLPGEVNGSTTYAFSGPISGLKITRTVGSGTVHVVVRGS